MRLVLLAMLSIAALLGMPRRARGQTPQVAVVVGAGASVPAAVVDEVRDASASRCAALPAPPHLVQVTLDDTGAAIEVDGKQRRVLVADWNEPAAARFVVVHVLDLAAPPAAVGALPAPPAMAVVTAAAPPARPAAALEVHAAPLFGRGVGAEDPLAAGVEVGATAYRRGLALSGALAWSHGVEEGAGGPAEASYDLWPFRIGVGWRRGRLGLGASAFYAAYRFTGVNHSVGATFGGGVSVRWYGPLGGGAGWFVGAGVDVLQHRVQLRVLDQLAYSMPRVAPSLSLGLTWRLP